MGRPAKDFSGARIGRLTVSCRVGTKGTAPLWAVKCDCGTEAEMTSAQLLGKTVSCGCYRLEVNTARLTLHGKAGKGSRRSRVYRIWHSMRVRCQNPKAINYERYGGRGITVCDRWQKFSEFFADMGEPPTPKHTIDRIDNSKGYAPENCRWATYLEQAQNKRPRS